MIPLVDLKAQYQVLKPEIAAAVDQVLESGQFVLGDQVAAFANPAMPQPMVPFLRS